MLSLAGVELIMAMIPYKQVRYKDLIIMTYYNTLKWENKVEVVIMDNDEDEKYSTCAKNKIDAIIIAKDWVDKNV